MGDWISLVVFLGTCLTILIVFAVLNRDRLRIVARVRRLGGASSAPAIEEQPPSPHSYRKLLARVPFVGALLSGSEPSHLQLLRRFNRAGIYSPNAPSIFLSVRILLICSGVALALGLGLANAIKANRVLPAGVILGGIGLLFSGLWLEARITRWQRLLRRGLPDAMDMLVLCLEGGTSLTAALQYVLGELRLAHPELGGELELVQREMMMGRTAGEAMQKFGQRCELEDVRTLASVLLQNERFGVSVAKALRIHADAMRQQRQQRAEEMAQKAAVKILFPTLLCIFPAIFIVILGPAAFRIAAVFARMK